MQTHENDDLSDLGFDMERHREALTSFARLDLTPAAVRPALRARDLVFVRLPSCRFTLGVTDDPARREAEEADRGGIGFAVIHRDDSAAQADHIRREVERYFSRHYPGRLLPGPTTPPDGTFVYVACCAPKEESG